MDSSETQLALDVGQSTTKALAIGARHEPVEFDLPCVRTHQPVRPQLAELVTAGIEEAEFTHRGVAVRRVALGVSGLTPEEGDAAELLRLLGPTSVQEVRLTHDSVTGYLGALGDARGAVVAAGTGAVTLGVGKSQVARVDGWGQLGDAGSGYWMGREALHAAMRAYDGRGPGTALLETAFRRWPDIESAYIQVQNDPQVVRLMASFAQDAAELAVDDEVAGSICRRAAAELAHSTVTALRRVGEDVERDVKYSGCAGYEDHSRRTDLYGDDRVHSPPAGGWRNGEPAPKVAAIGGIFRSGIIAEEFRRHVQYAAPQARLVRPRGSGLDGVRTLFGLGEGHPLRQLVSVNTSPLCR